MHPRHLLRKNTHLFIPRQRNKKLRLSYILLNLKTETLNQSTKHRRMVTTFNTFMVQVSNT